MPEPEAERLLAELRAQGTPERAAKERQYLRSDLEFVGASVPAVRRAVVRLYRERGDWRLSDVRALVEDLWGRRVHELRMAAVELLHLASDRLGPEDLGLLERLLRESRTWALVDGLATGPVAAIVERYPDTAGTLDRWAGDEDLWLRRTALLALLPALPRGEGDFGRFGRYADAMLSEREFFVRKAIGWVLREAAKQDPEEVVRWLAPRTHVASGVTVREAVKYLPDAERERLLHAYRRGLPAG